MPTDKEKTALEERVATLEALNKKLLERLEQQPQHVYPPPHHMHHMYAHMGFPPPPHTHAHAPPGEQQAAPAPAAAATRDRTPSAQTGRGSKRARGEASAAATTASTAKRPRPAPGETLKKYSRTPSRTPAQTDAAAKALPDLKPHRRQLPPPTDLRKVWFTEESIHMAEGVLERRAELDAEGGSGAAGGSGLIPKLWRPVGMMDRVLSVHAVGPARDASVHEAQRIESETAAHPPAKRRKVQARTASVPVEPYRAELKQHLLFNTLIRSELKDVSPTELVAVVRALLSVPDRTLRYIDSSVMGPETSKPGPRYTFLTHLHTMLTVLVWHSAEAVADTLEVCVRLIKQQKTGDSATSIGQPEMLEASSRLLAASPETGPLACPKGAAPYVLPDAVKRVKVLAGKVHALLKARLEG